MRTTSHYAHEADCESFFSIVKAVSDPNMFPSMLRVLSKVGYNTKSYKPGWEQIQERYYKKIGNVVDDSIDFVTNDDISNSGLDSNFE